MTAYEPDAKTDKRFPLFREGQPGELLVPRAAKAGSFFSRFLGLMGRSALPPGEGLLLQPCDSIHTFFMRFPIDVVCLDRDFRVVDIRPCMHPWRVFLPRAKTHAILELPAGDADRSGLRLGDRIVSF